MNINKSASGDWKPFLAPVSHFPSETEVSLKASAKACFGNKHFCRLLTVELHLLTSYSHTMVCLCTIWVTGQNSPEC